MDMDNSKSMNINIISIDAEKLVNLNWNIAAKNLKLQYVLDKYTEMVNLFDALSFDEYMEYTNDDSATVDQFGEFLNSEEAAKIKRCRIANFEKQRDRIVKSNIQTDSYQVNNSLYSGSLPISLDILKLKRLFPEELYIATEDPNIFKYYVKHYGDDLFSKPEGMKLYTDAIINVTFDRASYDIADELQLVNKVSKNTTKVEPAYKGKMNMTTRDLRQKFYDEGVILKSRFGDTLVKYVKYKRSSSKAREGSHLFIKEKLAEKMNDWKEFGICYGDRDKNVPLVAIKAYESLTSSGIEKVVRIDPKEILLINDVKKDVTIKASVTIELEDSGITAKDDDEYTVTNIIWDGQSLADTSLFDDEDSKEQKGMMLLRNSFFKSCAFNTNIQKWFDDKLGDNKKEFILDMFGHKVTRTDIKLITTPSSLKFLKFYDKFPGANEHDKKKNCYKKWLDTISDEFGICKHESVSPFGERHQLSYQIVNSLPLSKDQVRALLEYDLKHIENMKNDAAYFKSTINLENPLSSPSDALRVYVKIPDR